MSIPTNGVIFNAPLKTDLSSGSGHSMLSQGTITHQVIDNIPCTYFDGTTSEVYTGVGYGSFDPGIPFSGSLWMRATENNTTTKFIYISMSGGGFGLSIVGSTINISVRNGSGYTSIETTITLNHWHHVVFVASADTLKLYVDNVLIDTVVKSGSYNTSTLSYPISLGCSHGDGSAYYFNGWLSSVYMYNRVLTEEDISSLGHEFDITNTKPTPGVLFEGLYFGTEVPKNNQKCLVADELMIPFITPTKQMEFYKCTAVIPPEAPGDIITLSGDGYIPSMFPNYDCNGVYELQNASASGFNRVWVKSSDNVKIFSDNGSRWCIGLLDQEINNVENVFYYNESGTADPWNITSWICDYNANNTTLTLTTSTGGSGGTWNGYKAVLTDGVYAFASSVTTGLTYTSVTPVVGSIYSADALAKVDSLHIGIPIDGLVFYAPLAEDKATAETGQTLTKTGIVNYTTIEGSQCASFSGGKILIPDFDLAGLSDYAISAWMILTTAPSNSNTYIIFANATAGDFWRPAISANDGYGDNEGNQLGVSLRNTTTGDQGARITLLSTVKNPVGIWVNVILNYSSTTGVVNLYLNKEVVATYNTGITAVTSTTGSSAIGGTPIAETATYNFAGGIKGVRVYNRALTQAEISALYNEFN